MFPTIATIGPVTIYSFGLLLGLGLIFATYYVWKHGRPTSLSEEQVLDTAFLTILGGLVGARLLFVLSNLSQFTEDPALAWQFWKGGLSFWGAILGGTMVIFILARRLRWPAGSLFDLAAPALALGSFFGYIGAFLAGSAYGAVTDAPWGVRLLGLDGLRQPTQLIDAIWQLLIFIILIRIRPRSPFYGFLAFLYLILYSLERFLVEFWRGDRTYVWGGISQGQAIAILVGGASILLLYLRLARLQGSWRINISRIFEPRRAI
jgi:phosphatidylglycerol---prolipoprotein diacylglyceryl transferase